MKILKLRRWKPFLRWRVLPKWRHFAGGGARFWRSPLFALLILALLVGFFASPLDDRLTGSFAGAKLVAVETVPPSLPPEATPAPDFAGSPSAEEPKEALPEPFFLSSPVSGKPARVFGFGFDPNYGDYRFHRGLDFPAPLGAVVVAAAGGKVKEVIYTRDWQYQVVLAHAGDWETSYACLGEVYVKPGEEVARGTVLGRVGGAGGVEGGQGAHLHFELLRQGEALDPAEFLR